MDAKSTMVIIPKISKYLVVVKVRREGFMSPLSSANSSASRGSWDSRDSSSCLAIFAFNKNWTVNWEQSRRPDKSDLWVKAYTTASKERVLSKIKRRRVRDHSNIFSVGTRKLKLDKILWRGWNRYKLLFCATTCQAWLACKGKVYMRVHRGSDKRYVIRLA